MKSRLYGGLKNGLSALDRFTSRHRLPLGALLALALCGALALYNVSSGPLRNLHDIGGWGNRALLIALFALVHALSLLGCTALSRVNFARTALRQLILTAGMFIMQLAINQKGYAFVDVMLPVLRAMDAGGLRAGLEMASGVSAPMATLCYLITRGPIYDLYLLKLFAVAGLLMLSLLAMRAADRHGLGLRAEVLLALCLILPQGFLNAACSALPEVGAAALAALALCIAQEKPKSAVGAACLGAACALSGAALYALPAYAYVVRREGLKRLAIVPAVMAACCLPAIACGMDALQALSGLFAANFALPAYASGAPGLVNLIPRAAIEEIPQFAPTLRHFETDLITNAQQYYTQAHFVSVSRGMALACLAAYMGVCALAYTAKGKTPLHRAMIFALGALMACPNTSVASWLVLDVICLYAILAQANLRIPACIVLFVTMATSAYPMTEETMLPMIAACALCIVALCMLLDIIPMGKEEDHG